MYAFPCLLRSDMPPCHNTGMDPMTSENLADTTDLDPVTNPDAQQALSWRYSNVTVLIVPLTSGRFAIFGRDGILHTILDEAPTGDELRTLSQILQTKLMSRSAEAHFYGEHKDRDLAHDLRRSRTPERISKPRDTGEPLELDI